MARELKGSPKQISWAKSIRADRMDRWKRSDPSAFQHVQSSLENESSASWWITHREKKLKDVLSFIVEGGEKRAVVKPKATKAVSVVPEVAFSGCYRL